MEAFENLTTVKLSMKRKFENASLTEDLTKELFPHELRGANVARLSAVIQAKDGIYTLSSVASAKDTKLTKAKQNILFGEVTIENILRSLQKRGYMALTVTEPEMGVYRIDIGAEASLIFSANETKIETKNDAKKTKIRQDLKQVVIENFYVM